MFIKIELHPITKKEKNNFTIETKYDKHGVKISMHESIKEYDEVTIKKENMT